MAFSLASVTGSAEPPVDRFDYAVRSDTHVQLFERALLPGPAGATVRPQRVAPIHEYLTAYVVDLDAPWGADSVDAELGAWQSFWIGDARFQSRFDADISVAAVTARYEPFQLKLGRQVITSGAARYTRLDGLAVEASLTPDVRLEAYGGFTVLPRWSDRPGYHHLGSAADTLVRDPQALPPDPERTGHWAAGVRAGYDLSGVLTAGLSFHEERDRGELGRRNLALDLYAEPFDAMTAGLDALFDAERLSMADLRAWARYEHEDLANITGQYVRTDPALFLSHQSVLSVFGTDGFDEVGADVDVDPLRWLQLGAAGYVQIWSGDDLGARLSGRARVTPDSDERLTLQAVYSRVSAIDNGYHSIRTSVRYRFLAQATAVAEQYTYLYDEPINGHDMSLVEALSINYVPLDRLSLLVGGSIAQTPYAELDAQVQAIATLSFDGVGGRR